MPIDNRAKITSKGANHVGFKVELNLVDRIMNAINPKGGLERIRARAAISFLTDGGYVVPGSSKRTMRSWHPSSKTADEDTIQKLPEIRKGCRDLAMNTPIAIAPLTREVTNAIGWGLGLQSKIDREVLNLTDEEAEKWERSTEREFKLWAESKNCDSTRTQNFYELQAHAMYNTSLSGDIFIAMPYIPKPNFPYQLCLQCIEADFVSNPNGNMETNRCAGGVEVDSNGAPIAYHVRVPKGEYMDLQLGMTVADEWKKIPVYGSNSSRRNVLHLYHKLRPGQRRGLPMLAPVIDTLKQLSRLTEAELAASVINSFFTVFVKTNPQTGGLGEGYVEEDKETDAETTPSDEKLYELGSGSVVELAGEGQSIELADPKRPNDSFEPFFLALVKQIGAALQIPFEQMMLYFSSSYSAARGAILEAWKFYRARRMWASWNLCQPVYDAFLIEAISIGRIVAPGFFDDEIIRRAWSGSAWIGPGQGQIDPLKETQAAKMRLEIPLSDHETEYAAIHGTDWEPSVNRLSRELKYMEERNVTSGLNLKTGAQGFGGGGSVPNQSNPADQPTNAPPGSED
jgi:lambda family phage portal protein